MPMKRWIFRGAALAVLGAIGVIAIAQAQWGSSQPAPNAEEAASPKPLSVEATASAHPLRPVQEFKTEESPKNTLRSAASERSPDDVQLTAGFHVDTTAATSRGALPSKKPSESTEPQETAKPAVQENAVKEKPLDDVFSARVLPVRAEKEKALTTADSPSTSPVPPPSKPNAVFIPGSLGRPFPKPTSTTTTPLPTAPSTLPTGPNLAPVRSVEPANGPAMTGPAATGPAMTGPALTGPSFGAAPSNNPPAASPAPTIVRTEPAPLNPDPSAAPARPGALPAVSPFGDKPQPAPELGLGAEGSGQPGKQNIEGPQSPQMTIQKFAPPEVQVGKPATFRISVANKGSVLAHGVEVRDAVPKGAQLMATKPRASRGAGGELVWELGAMKPGEETTVEMQIMPVAEGEIGSVATVRFHADASAKVVATKPVLVVKSTAPSKVMIGDQLNLTISISNSGSGVATGVILEERIPAGLQHSAGAELEYEIGTLKPGESRQIQLPLLAVRPGAVSNMLVARGDGSLKVEDRLDLEIVSPQLNIAAEGPKRRYLEREATYTVAVSNPGTAAAKQIELVAYLPRGLKFVSANNAGHFEPASQSVHWLLEELPANDSDKVELVTLPIEPGDQKIRFQGRADKGLAVEREHAITVEGIAAVLFEVTDRNDPIEVGGETMYEIRVVNQGSKAATNVRINATLPPGLKAVAAEGPARHTIDAGRVAFESLANLAPKADTTYRIRVQGVQPGDQRVRVQLMTDEMQEPVTKEESTRVYRDE